jgi:hypothetical protein
MSINDHTLRLLKSVRKILNEDLKITQNEEIKQNKLTQEEKRTNALINNLSDFFGINTIKKDESYCIIF